MTTTANDHGRVVIPDSDEAQSLAERFGRFLALGASRSSGVGAAEALARDQEPHRVEQQDRDRSAVPSIRNEVGARVDAPHPDLELGVDCEHSVTASRDEADASAAPVAPPDSHARDEGGDQLCMSY
jgi:hypothetical protein